MDVSVSSTVMILLEKNIIIGLFYIKQRLEIYGIAGVIVGMKRMLTFKISSEENRNLVGVATKPQVKNNFYGILQEKTIVYHKRDFICFN